LKTELRAGEDSFWWLVDPGNQKHTKFFSSFSFFFYHANLASMQVLLLKKLTGQLQEEKREWNLSENKEMAVEGLSPARISMPLAAILESLRPLICLSNPALHFFSPTLRNPRTNNLQQLHASKTQFSSFARRGLLRA
jgi:hypothetical protein